VTETSEPAVSSVHPLDTSATGTSKDASAPSSGVQDPLSQVPTTPQPASQTAGLRPSVDAVVADEALRTRIQQLVEQPNLPFLRHPLTSVIIGFLFSGVFGTYLANHIQQTIESNKRKEEIREARRATAVSVFETVPALLNRGAALYGNAALSLLVLRASFSPDPSFIKAYGNDPKPIQEEAKQYHKKVEEFRTELEGREVIDNARICASFGEKIADEHARLAIDFYSAYLDLKALGDKSIEVNQTDSDSATSRAFSLKEHVHGLSVDMANVLVTEQVDLAEDNDKAGTGFLGTANCKANPEFAKPRILHK